MQTLVGLQDSVHIAAKDLRAKGYLVKVTIDNDCIFGKVAAQHNPYLPLTVLNIIDGQYPQNVERFIDEMKTILDGNYET